MPSLNSEKRSSAPPPPVIVITGASQGIGAAIAHEFAHRGPCTLALLARNAAALRQVAAQCQACPGVRAEIFPCDLTDPIAVERVTDAVTGGLGPVDILINNAGQFEGAPFLEFSLADFDRMLAVNLRSVFLVSQPFASGMAKRNRGEIVNICSVASLQAHPGGTGYCAAKAGLLGLTRVMREELKEHGIRVTAVLPGATFTPSWEGAGVAPERMMPAADVARTVVDLTRLSRRTVVEEIVLRPLAGDL
ncbi:MAG: SDR family oxidoreductase [Opitutales bacterium]